MPAYFESFVGFSPPIKLFQAIVALPAGACLLFRVQLNSATIVAEYVIF